MNELLSLKKYFIKYRYKFILGIICIILANGFSNYIPIFIKNSIDSFSKIKDPELLKSALYHYGLYILIAAIIGGFFRYMIRQTIIVASRLIENDLRNDFWKHLQLLPYKFFVDNSTGNLMSHATNDISAVRNFIGPAVMYSLDNIIKFVFVFYIMAKIDLWLTLYCLLPLPFISYFVMYLGKIVNRRFIKIQEQFSVITTKAQENFSGIRVIKAYTREDYETEEFAKASYKYLKLNMKMIKIHSLTQPIMHLLVGISIMIALFIGGTKVMNHQLTIGDISAFVVYLGLLIWPMFAFGWVTNMVQQAAASMKRLNKIFAEKYTISDTTITDKSIKKIKGQIEFKNVSFKYAEKYILKNISIKVEQGKTVAIIGKTGSGKSTLLNLIPRLYDVSEGSILIDNKDVKSIPISVLRKNIAYVPQEPYLFSDTLQNNILYGVDTENEDILGHVTQVANLVKDIESFPSKLETIIGERGITLSGGQKQRSAMSRALAIYPKVLILDDSFSAVDTNTEEEILKRLKEYMKDRTCILVSHRISTVKDSDYIYVLDEGEILEEGTHEKLLEINGLYADIYQKQQLEKEINEM